MVRCVCQTCPDKGCGAYHDKCEKYQQFVREKKEENRKASKESFITSYHRKSVYRSIAMRGK